MSFSWKCPYCNQIATITQEDEQTEYQYFSEGSKYHRHMLKIRTIGCPNQDCGEYTLTVDLSEIKNEKKIGRSTYENYEYFKASWQLIPRSNAKVFPSYIPQAIKDDYIEACLIRSLSPKASATLARRCLQGMIRDFWSIKKNKLYDAITALEEKIDTDVWTAIDGIRTIGNIGAHMEKDINLIIDVDPKEVDLLLELIEMLVDEWYVERQQRKERLKKIAEIAKAKKGKKKETE